MSKQGRCLYCNAKIAESAIMCDTCFNIFQDGYKEGRTMSKIAEPITDKKYILTLAFKIISVDKFGIVKESSDSLVPAKVEVLTPEEFPRIWPKVQCLVSGLENIKALRK